MANPQIENGHIDIAHEIAEALCRINLSAYESRVLWALWRKTYGWHKKSDAISLRQFETLTGLSRQHICRTIRKLEARDIIRADRSNRITIYQFQKNYELWEGVVPIQVVPIEAVPIRAISSPYSGNRVVPMEATKVVPIQAHTKEKKETVQKKLYKRKGAIKKTFGEFNNVLLTDKEYQQLQVRFGNETVDRIENLSSAIASKGYKYQSHYATILSWARRDEKKGGQYGTHKQSSQEEHAAKRQASIGAPIVGNSKHAARRTASIGAPIIGRRG